MLTGFKQFLLRGNVIDLAVAVVVGAAFSAIVTAFTGNIISPLINSLGGTGAVQGLGFRIRGDNPATFVDIGKLITAGINFVIIAAVVYFIIVVPFEKLKSLRAKVGDDAAALTETELLTEIRDLLAAQAHGSTEREPTHTATATSDGPDRSAPPVARPDGPGRHEQ